MLVKTTIFYWRINVDKLKKMSENLKKECNILKESNFYWRINVDKFRKMSINVDKL